MTIKFLRLSAIVAAAFAAQAATPSLADAAAPTLEFDSSFGRRISRAEGMTNYPSGIAVDSNSGAVYVMDLLFNRVQKFDADGNFLLQWNCKQGLGLTVDPVKIDSLEQFGTLATVTDRVLTVEEGRDGVTDVKLRGAAEERPAGTLYYAITYEVTSSRGKKVYLCRYAIARGRLFVLQLQAPADTWDADAGVRDALGAVAASLEVAS